MIGGLILSGGSGERQILLRALGPLSLGRHLILPATWQIRL